VKIDGAIFVNIANGNSIRIAVISRHSQNTVALGSQNAKSLFWGNRLVFSSHFSEHLNTSIDVVKKVILYHYYS
jgi:hypothetical protein